MIANLGSEITVRVYRDFRSRDGASDGIDVQAVVTSAGPPGVVADWAITLGDRRWLLVRKSKNTGAKYEAIEGDRG